MNMIPMDTMADNPVVLCSDPLIAEAARDDGWQAVVVPAVNYPVLPDGSLRDELRQFNRFVLCFDDPELRDGVAIRIGDVLCRWIDVPRDLESLGPSLHMARPMWTEEIAGMDDIPEPERVAAFKVGIPALDDHGFRIVRPCFWPIIGPYGSGKSVLARQLVANLHHLYGWKTLYTAFEEAVKPAMRDDFRRHFSPSKNTFMGAKDVEVADRRIADALKFLRRPRGQVLDADRLIDRIDFAARVYDIRVVVIDPVNEIDHRVPKGMSKTDYMGDFIMRLKQLADDHGLVMMCLAHPPKDANAGRHSKGKIYTLNDGADTAHYGNKADIGWCVWRPFRDFNATGPAPPTFLNIDKTKRHDVMGKPTMAAMELAPNGRFQITTIGQAAYQMIAGE